MKGFQIYHKKKIVFTFLAFVLLLMGLMGRLVYIMLFQSEYYSKKAVDLHERERSIKAARGRILDRNGIVLADNRVVCTISVIHSQIEEPEKVAAYLSETLDIDYDTVWKKVNKYSSIERIKNNVDKAVGDEIRKQNLSGVKVDEDYKRFYPYSTLASKVLGFTGADNQGILGLEVKYDDVLQGKNGTILTVTDAKGLELAQTGESRIEPIAGNDLTLTLDMNIQSYATQLAMQVMEAKEAEGVSMIVMNPNTGAILAMVDVPEYDLNHPFELEYAYGDKTQEILDSVSQNTTLAANRMWRNGCINDTYEPGSTFKIITAAAGLESKVVRVDEQFNCPGFCIVEDRKIRCHKTQGHGAETFLTATMNSCNPVFINVGLRLGVDRYYAYFEKFGLLNKTGIDLPGEAGTIMHKKENMGMVELATVSFGQSFQITPIQLITTVSSLINGGHRVTPHLADHVTDSITENVTQFTFRTKDGIISDETGATLRMMLEKVVSEGGGKKAYIEGYSIGGKTATSQTLPRGTGQYIASFIGFEPADDPQIIALVTIKKPQGVYYGGQIAAPVIRTLYENILPYLEGIRYN
ncbi:MAG: penicillin-binding transpeptidase domain-containing protein [Lachnospiraceae bacterium]|nr:peptidoglycan glycosyltransferase [Lachnospiraceae bacterium]MDD5853100.1 penicillin-binding transpeptidase domain-containing protein [Lachnospiraceae bacterium]